jgi:preprotein translocase subunit SecF
MFNIYNKNISFLKFYKQFYLLSFLLIVISFISFFSKGLNLGIDFKGGTVIEMQFDKKYSATNIREALIQQELGDVKVKEFGNSQTFLAIFEKKSGKSDFIPNVKTQLEKSLTETINFRRVEMVGPKISKELTKSGIYAVLIALILMLFYIWLRFEWQFSLGSILALLHDVMLTLGAFSIIGFEFNLSIIAAILTIVGYSMNDTVVIYDRIRENLKKDDKSDLLDLINISVNETLPRTLKTSITTLLALIAIYFFGGEILRGFSFALIWGVIVGTYSSIFIAAPLILIFNVK